ncbi:MAG: type I-C CRISPR-associated protein Cas5c [Chloroflexi bacterium]|jgi:CRISPR-associated protein Cas5d|nr:type I-C CRISPR-associated protein Cas5c [Chloroflexota bacterium]
MNGSYPPLAVKVWGEFACFTRPEMKAERVSYSVMTPSAARGVLEAIFWKPAFRWQVREIWVLNEIRWFSIRRNEVNARASPQAARRWAKEGGGYRAGDDRAQRHALVLRDVAYLIRAEIRLHPGETADVAKFRDQFRRRVREGRCFNQPYLGCREFSAFFAEPTGQERPIDRSEDLGLMLWDLDYNPDGSGTPRFFHAHLDRGVLRIPLEGD